jgi:16S rRNA (cytidine1402-2'-O)-methyltransferase
MDTPFAPGLYIVATPIGNLGDITLRAVETLRGVSAIACEDTRVTGKLLHHLGIKQRLIRYDDHASEETRDYVLGLAAQGPVALVSDAGTPLIADPGFKLVRLARERGIAITSLPGPSAAIMAITLSGIASDRFLFAGFLPSKDKARRDALAELAAIPSTLILYETAPRLCDTLQAITDILPGREVAVARELTKKFEECRTGSAEELIAHYRDNPPKGEIALVIAPPIAAAPDEHDVDALLTDALATLKASQAAAQVSKVTGLDRKMLYARAMELK